MRSTSGPDRDTWATYVRVARERAGLDKTELGRKIGKNRATVQRWESGANRPNNADLVARVAEVLGLDQDETLAAAGLKPGVTAPTVPTREYDEEEEMILRADVDQRTKELALEQLHLMRVRDQRRRREDLEFLLGIPRNVG